MVADERLPVRPIIPATATFPGGSLPVRGQHRRHGRGRRRQHPHNVPPAFRITYTGSGTTCAVDIADSATGETLKSVFSLHGGGFVRVFLDTAVVSTVFISDIIGCRGGRLNVGPNPDFPEFDPRNIDPDSDGVIYTHSGEGDSEAFVVPDAFRLTYTGTGTTCALDVLDAWSGYVYESIFSLDGGGLARVFLEGRPHARLHRRHHRLSRRRVRRRGRMTQTYGPRRRRASMTTSRWRLPIRGPRRQRVEG